MYEMQGKISNDQHNYKPLDWLKGQSEDGSMVRQHESSSFPQQSQGIKEDKVEEWTVTPLNPISLLSPTNYKHIKTLQIDRLES